MVVEINIKQNELDTFIERMLLEWWESHEEGCSDPLCDDLIGWIQDSIEREATTMMSVLGMAHHIPFTDVIFKLNGQDTYHIIQNDKLQKIINKHWENMINEEATDGE